MADEDETATDGDAVTARWSYDAEVAVARIKKDLEKARPMPDGTIMRFTSVANNGQHYVYAAVFAAGYWYLTGDNSYFARRYTHQDLMAALIGHGHRIVGLAIASEFKEIAL